MRKENIMLNVGQIKSGNMKLLTTMFICCYVGQKSWMAVRNFLIGLYFRIWFPSVLYRKIKFIETSAVTGENVNEAFLMVARGKLQSYMPGWLFILEINSKFESGIIQLSDGWDGIKKRYVIEARSVVSERPETWTPLKILTVLFQWDDEDPVDHSFWLFSRPKCIWWKFKLLMLNPRILITCIVWYQPVV